MTRSSSKLVSFARCLTLTLAIPASVACAGQITARPGAPAPVAADPAEVPEYADAGEGGEGTEPAAGDHGAGEDRHWMQEDDYFISEEPWQKGRIHVELAKMKKPPGPDTKDQALFFAIKDSREVWTRHYWRTRPAGPDDLELGAFLLCFPGNSQDGVFRGPKKKNDARIYSWLLGRVTDVSDTFKRIVWVGGARCGFDAIRTPESPRAAGG